MAAVRRLCPTPRCPNLQPCSRPGHERKPFATAQRSTTLYQSPQWKRESKAFLAEHPFCVAKGIGTESAYVICGQPATIVDHRIPHRGNEAAFWNQGNWQSLCVAHHQAKTGRETRERVGA